ncbi:aminoglycoside phosphotransferase family protein [Paenibacillus ginsengarvi]|nr:aminoglycoside phosphotransferase family protein [Paenibacillus ginsengarvi]
MTASKPLYFLLARDNGTRVFMTPVDGVMRIPVYEFGVAEQIGFDNPAPYLYWFEQRYAIPVFRTYMLESAAADITIMVLEAACGSDDDAPDDAWIPYLAAAAAYPEHSQLRDVLLHLPDHYRSSRVMPWVETGFRPYLERLIGFTAETPIRDRDKGTEIEQLKNAYVSSVFRCRADGADRYLKISASIFVRELEITKVLREWNMAPLPVWVAADSDSGSVLMEDMGGCDLPAHADKEQLAEIVREYARIQLASIQRITPQLSYPFRLHRTSQLAELAESVSETAALLLGDSPYRLTAEELEKLAGSMPYWRSMCERIASSAIPDCLNHADLRPGNIRFTDQGILFFDWAWSDISHPFFGLSAFLNVIRRTVSDSDRAYVRDAYLQQWSRYGTAESLAELYSLVDETRNLYFAIGDSVWLREIREALKWRVPPFGSPDAWTLERRQYYYARVIRKLIRTL